MKFPAKLRVACDRQCSKVVISLRQLFEKTVKTGSREIQSFLDITHVTQKTVQFCLGRFIHGDRFLVLCFQVIAFLL